MGALAVSDQKVCPCTVVLRGRLCETLSYHLPELPSASSGNRLQALHADLSEVHLSERCPEAEKNEQRLEG